MLPIFDFLREMTPLAVAARLLLAFVCGGLIGLEREFKRRPAGFRTHILICLGAALTTLTSQYMYLSLGLFTDVSRMGAQVIAGVGFIGAGTIIVTRQRRVKGLTTAAGLWTAAIIGLACGAGYVECAVAATLLILCAELLLIKLEYRLFNHAAEINVYLEYRDVAVIESVIARLGEARATITETQISRTVEEDRRYCAVLSLQPDRASSAGRLLELVQSAEGVLLAEEL